MITDGIGLHCEDGRESMFQADNRTWWEFGSRKLGRFILTCTITSSQLPSMVSLPGNNLNGITPTTAE